MHSRLRVLIALLLAACWALALAGPVPAQDGKKQPPDNNGPHLQWVELSVGGLPLKVRSGGVATLHPDAPFRVLGAKSDSWLDMGLSYRLAGFPELDLNRYHTMAKLLGPRIYDTKSLELEVLKGGAKIGSISLLLRLLPIDWLRRAARANSLDDKITYTERALELTPDDPLLIERLADLYAEAGRFPEAAELLASHARGQKDPRWLERLATLYQASGQKEQAAAALSKLVALRPGDSALLERLATLYEQMGRWEEAGALLERLSETRRRMDKAAILARLAAAQEKGGKAEMARQTLERAVRLDADQPGYWQELARLRASAGDQAGALAALERAAALAPRDRELHRALSQAFLKAGDKRKAAAELEKVARLAPQDPAPLLSLSKLYVQLGWRKALARTYRRLGRLKPSDPDLSFNLAVLAFEDGDYKKTLELLEPVQASRSGDPEFQELKLRALLGLKRWEAAGKLAQKLLAQKPRDLRLWLAVLSRLGEARPARAAELLELVLAKNPKSVKLWEMKAALALGREEPAEAIKSLAKAVELAPKDLRLKFQLAGLLESQGRDDEALKLYEAILDADPAYPQAEERYLDLRTRQLDHKNSAAAKP